MLCLLLMVLVACTPNRRPLPTQRVVIPTVRPTTSPTPPPDAKFQIGTKVILKHEAFSVPLADGPYLPDGKSGRALSCYTTVIPTILSVVRTESGTFYLVDCNGLTEGWLPEDAIDVEQGR
jgi:hypothetical protein